MSEKLPAPREGLSGKAILDVFYRSVWVCSVCDPVQSFAYTLLHRKAR